MAAGLVAWRFGLFGGPDPQPRANPLASIDAADITAATLFKSGEPQPAAQERLRAVARAVASLKAAPRLDGRGVNWAGATQIRVGTAGGVTLTLQAVPADAGALVRITADPGPGSDDETRARASAIRGLRHDAYKVDPAAAAALLER